MMNEFHDITCLVLPAYGMAESSAEGSTTTTQYIGLESNSDVNH